MPRRREARPSLQARERATRCDRGLSVTQQEFERSSFAFAATICIGWALVLGLWILIGQPL